MSQNQAVQSLGHGPAEGCGCSQLVLQALSGPEASVAFHPPPPGGSGSQRHRWVGPQNQESPLMMSWVLFGAVWCWKASQVDLIIWSPPSWVGQAVVAVGWVLTPRSSAWLRAAGAAWRVG